MTLELSVDWAPDVRQPVALEQLQRAARCALENAADTAADIEIVVDVRVTGEAEAAELNRIHRHKPYATNVLSFPAGVDLPGLRVLGDLAICAPVVAREAAEQHKSLAAHFTHMLVHGLLHLLGFDHIGDDEAIVMEDLERRILAELGYGDPYQTPAPDFNDCLRADA